VRLAAHDRETGGGGDIQCIDFLRKWSIVYLE